MNNQYSVDFYISKFEAIPNEQWCTGVLDDGAGRHCALGHCGEVFIRAASQPSAESRALSELFWNALETSPNRVNDYPGKTLFMFAHPYSQPTPKARILAALYDIKARAESALDQYELRKLKLSTQPKPEQEGVGV